MDGVARGVSGLRTGSSVVFAFLAAGGVGSSMPFFWSFPTVLIKMQPTLWWCCHCCQG